MLVSHLIHQEHASESPFAWIPSNWSSLLKWMAWNTLKRISLQCRFRNDYSWVYEKISNLLNKVRKYVNDSTTIVYLFLTFWCQAYQICAPLIESHHWYFMSAISPSYAVSILRKIP